MPHEQTHNIEFITPPNMLKIKVGSGGLHVSTLKQAQNMLDDHRADFMPIAQSYLDQMAQGIKEAQSTDHTMERRIDYMLLPCSQLRANGRLFQYSMVTRVAGRFAAFMDDIKNIDNEIIKIASAFHGALRLILVKNMRNEAAKGAQSLLDELDDLCRRYNR